MFWAMPKPVRVESEEAEPVHSLISFSNLSIAVANVYKKTMNQVKGQTIRHIDFNSVLGIEKHHL